MAWEIGEIGEPDDAEIVYLSNWICVFFEISNQLSSMSRLKIVANV